MRRRRSRLAVAVGVVALIAAAPPARASDGPPRPNAAAWLLVDTADGTRLAAHSPNRQRSIASTTKLMTAFLALRELSPGEKVTAPAYHPGFGESLMGLKKGEVVTVHDLLYGLLLPSGNDAAVALADAVSGSVPDFVRRMNQAAHRLGLEDTHYANPIGLDAPGNFSTAADLLTLTQKLRRDPVFREIVNTPDKAVTSGSRTIRLENTNALLHRFGWVNGVKTGHTIEAGNVLVTSGTQKGVTLLSVMLGAPSEAVRDAGSLALLNYGFSRYRRVTPVTVRERFGSTALSYRDERLPLVAGRRVSFVSRKGQDVETRVVRERAEVSSAERGDRLGLALVTLDGETQARVPLVAAHSVGGPTLLDKVDSALPGSRTDLWLLVGAAVALLAALAILIGLAISRRSDAR
jgi:D-alanyl-D-alanine carboxypeptidase (penicillin-binding protein 5/6)